LFLSYTEGFLLGLGAAVPLGPINILIMNEAIKRYRNGVLVGLGAMSSDIVYLFLIIFGLVALINQPIILNTLSVFGGGFLIFLAYLIYKNKDATLNAVEDTVVQQSMLKLYAKGFALTFINPYTIGFWLSASSYIASEELDIFVTLFGMLSAIVLWITLMPYLVHKTKHKISAKVSHWISIASATILFGFGAMMFVKLLNDL